MVKKSDFRRVSDVVWEIPKEYRPDMKVPARLYASEDMLDHILKDRSVEQLINSATLPGLVRYAIAMPDIHQGYGFPIGGVVASRTSDGVISPGGVGYDINCLTAEARVLHAHGYYRRIGEMGKDWQHARLVCQDFSGGKPIATGVMRYLELRPHQSVYRVVTESGFEIRATEDHPFWTPRGMVELARLRPGDQVALYPFEGVPYEEPSDEVIVDENCIKVLLHQLGKSGPGNAIAQIVNQLKQRDLLPLRYDSPQLPHLLKLLGFVFGDGTISFGNRRRQGQVTFFGRPEDLEDIREDIRALGFTPNQVYTRGRQHQITTPYHTYEFSRRETSVLVSSSALATLLVALGAPYSRKACQEYCVPAWLWKAPLWQKRLFLAALFGAELSKPKTLTGHGYNFYTPVLSLNKHEGLVENGRAFLEEIAALLENFGVQVKTISVRREQTNRDGSVSYRLRLILSSAPDSLINLWSKVGFEYNRERRMLANVAVQYLRLKQRVLEQKEQAAQQALALYTAGVALSEIYEELQGPFVSRDFLVRSLNGDRRTAPRVGKDFPTFEAFRAEVTEGLGDSGMVWERIARIEPVAYEGLVYDFTVDHPDHNFVANGFVVSNCGVRLLGTHIDREELGDALADLATAIYKNCPSGVGKGGSVPLSVAELEELMVEGARWALRRGFAREEDLARTEEGGRMEGADPSKVSRKAKQRGKDQVGTLGAGNHFIELDEVVEVYDEEAADAMGLFPGQVVVQIHCGSRGFGHQICTDYVRVFQGSLQKYGIKLPDRELVYAPFNSPEGQDYLAAMKCAANYAFANRQVLTFHVRRSFEEALAGKVRNWDVFQVYDIAHNMGKVEVHEIDGERVQVCVHRKGATRAFGPGFEGLPPEYRSVGQPVLVPGSMGTASWVLVGTPGSMRESFGSTCHGAGRMMSRRKAKKTVHGAELRDELQSHGIEVRAGSMSGLAEEAPVAYKDVDEVVEVVHRAGIAKKVARLVPIAVIKG